jgi:hypothetical protein
MQFIRRSRADRLTERRPLEQIVAGLELEAGQPALRGAGGCAPAEFNGIRRALDVQQRWFLRVRMSRESNEQCGQDDS